LSAKRYAAVKLPSAGRNIVSPPPPPWRYLVLDTYRRASERAAEAASISIAAVRRCVLDSDGEREAEGRTKHRGQSINHSRSFDVWTDGRPAETGTAGEVRESAGAATIETRYTTADRPAP